MRSVNFVPHPRYGPTLGWADTEIRQKNAPKIKIYVSSIFSESTCETAIEKYPLFLESSCSVGDSAMRQYGPKPGFGPYFIRWLSRGEQLESKNEEHFFIGVLRVDFENEIFIFGAYFRRVLVSA